MEIIRFGRRRLSLHQGKVSHTSTTVTERAHYGEDENAFITRLTKMYCEHDGSIEIVFKAGRPEYAIITLEPEV